MSEPQKTEFKIDQKVWPVNQCAHCHLTHHASLKYIDSVRPFIVTKWLVSNTGHENYHVKGYGFTSWDCGNDKACTSFKQEDLFATKNQAKAACNKRNKDIV